MGTMPVQDPSYYVDTSETGSGYIKKMMEESYNKAISLNQSFWQEADTDSRFLEGDQTLWNDYYGNIPSFQKRQFNFNRLRRIVNMITGRQRQYRKSTVINSRKGSSEETADLFTECMFYIEKTSNVSDIISQGFHGAVTTGMNLLSLWMDYSQDPINGDIKLDNLSYNGFLIDPYFKKHDLSDCNFVWTRKFVSKLEAKLLIPDREKEIDAISPYSSSDNKFYFLPETYDYGKTDLIAYDEYWYRSTRERDFIVDMKTGESMEWEGDQSKLDEYLAEFPQLKTVRQTVPTVKLAIMLQDRLMYDGPHPLQIDSYPFIPVLAYYSPQIPNYSYRVQGVIRGLRDSQFLYNRRKLIELDILESQINSGFIYKESALVDPKDVFASGQGRGIPVKDETNIQTDLVQVQPPQIPPTMLQVSQTLGEEMQQISGVNEELLGSADDDKTGILSMLRQGAGLTTLQILFDNLDFSQKLIGSKVIEIIQKNWGPGKIAQITQQEVTPEFYNKNWGKYDAVIEEGLNTATQRNMQFAQLIQLREMGISVPSKLLIESSNIQNKKELVEAIQAEEEKAEQAQREAQQLQQAITEAEIQDTQARAIANTGLGIERESRVKENESLSVERKARAALEEIQAAKELEDMDISQIVKLLETISLIKGKQDAEEDQLNQGV